MEYYCFREAMKNITAVLTLLGRSYTITKVDDVYDTDVYLLTGEKLLDVTDIFDKGGKKELIKFLNDNMI